MLDDLASRESPAHWRTSCFLAILRSAFPSHSLYKSQHLPEPQSWIRAAVICPIYPNPTENLVANLSRGTFPVLFSLYIHCCRPRMARSKSLYSPTASFLGKLESSSDIRLLPDYLMQLSSHPQSQQSRSPLFFECFLLP